MDCAANAYLGHLLCHDDVIGNRLVSFVLCKSRTRTGPRKMEAPSSSFPVGKALTNAQGSAMSVELSVLFKVEPGKSHHAVAEVLGDKPLDDIRCGTNAGNGSGDGLVTRASSLKQAPRC